jgi:hypothetical protein
MYQVTVVVGSMCMCSVYDTFAIALVHAHAAAGTMGCIISECRCLDYYITIRENGEVALMPVKEDESEVKDCESLGLSRP